MKKIAIIITSVCLALSLAQAQKKYEKIVYSDVTTEGKGMSITAKNGVSNEKYTKFNLKIRNNGDEILFYKANESKLIVNGKEYKPDEKPLAIGPGETDNRVVDIKGADFMVSDYKFEVNGVYKLTNSKPVDAPEFQLPPSHNEFKAGNFTCTMYNLKKETDKTVVKFDCRYTGNKIGVIQTGKAAVKLPDGTEVANAKSNTEPYLLEKGDSKKITLYWNRMQGGKSTDMQKVNLMILWRDTFSEAETQKLDPVTLDFKIDEAKSK
jgi:hypothetical protein